jgi:hypothetical protein
MRRYGIRAHALRRYRVCTTDSKHSLPVAANLAGENFAAKKSDQVWLADITYIPTGEGWLYLAVILDLFTRKVVGWAMRDHMRAELTMAALTMAIQRRRPGPDLLHHSAVSTPPAITARSWAAAITQSMSRKANCWDGSVGGLWLAVVAAATHMGSTTAVVPGGADAARFRLARPLSGLDGSRDLVVQLAEGQSPPLVLRVLDGRVIDADREELERLRNGLDRML